jgi:type IV secretion system protein TrbL
VLLLAWLIVIVSFFVLAVQLFVTLIEFKLTTLAGFVLVPFALWNKTAFLAERVLGNVVSSGIKVLVLAVIVGIGTGIFGQFTWPTPGDITIDNALAIMLAALSMLGLGIFGPSIASGLVSGAPQLGAGAAAGTLMGAGGLVAAGGAAIAGSARLAGAAARSSVGAATTLASGARALASTYQQGASASGLKGASGVEAGVAHLAKSGAAAIGQGIRSMGSKLSGASSGTSGAASSGNPSSSSSSSAASQSPAWAKRMQTRQRLSQGVSQAAQSLRSGDHGGSGVTPKLNPDG